MAQLTAHRPLLLGDVAPNFTADTTEGKIDFHNWIGNSWCVFFSHPKDFTPVCTTELGTAARMKSEFDKRNVKVIALSCDSLPSHKEWIKDINETQKTNVNFPIIADEKREIAELYWMIHPSLSENATVRSVYIIDPNKKLRLILTYPQATGRNFNEILRAIDAIQLTDKYSVATPANWKDGEDCVILPTITDPKVLQEKFPRGWKELKPYLRLTPQPDKKI